ncbi:hypothetical protein HII31_13561 [Pseudocercospora fuligena]|uniref:Uncharacterized protein n=1 Tax=Pseudocercospora fuligena TaxID=685502 RepID=A0A8H6R868_9PEZI|nr:hypothetical protein HII31_13561 [Pseudocercospora fuligena]
MAQIAILEEVNLDDLHSTVEEYRRHLAKCEEEKAECVQTLEARQTKIETVHSHLGRAMQSVFATYKDWAYTPSMEIQVDFSFRITLVKCDGYAQQLRRLEAEYIQLGQERHKSGIDRKLWVKTMKEATRALNSARCAYRKVQEEFLLNHAASALADRAIFPHELTTRNIAKIPESLAKDEDSSSSLNGDFEHRFHRLTANPAEQFIPAMDPEFVLLVKSFRDTKEQVEDIRKRFKSLQDDYARSVST